MEIVILILSDKIGNAMQIDFDELASIIQTSIDNDVKFVLSALGKQVVTKTKFWRKWIQLFIVCRNIPANHFFWDVFRSNATMCLVYFGIE